MEENALPAGCGKERKVPCAAAENQKQTRIRRNEDGVTWEQEQKYSWCDRSQQNNSKYLIFMVLGESKWCRAGPWGRSSHHAAEWIRAAQGDSARTVRRDTSEAPSRQPPHPSFIWEYDLYFLKWRVLNPAIKELRGLPRACHSNESMAGIWGLFNREKLVFTMPLTGIWRNLSGGEERAS